MFNAKKVVRKNVKQVLSLLISLVMIAIIIACSNQTDNVDNIDSDRRIPRRVSLISDGDEHERFENHHSFRYGGYMAGGGGGMFCEDTLATLASRPLGASPEIIVEGEKYREARYTVYERIDGEWMRLLYWRGDPCTSIFDSLESGEYMLLITVSWGNAQIGHVGQYFFKFAV